MCDSRHKYKANKQKWMNIANIHSGQLLESTLAQRVMHRETSTSASMHSQYWLLRIILKNKPVREVPPVLVPRVFH